MVRSTTSQIVLQNEAICHPRRNAVRVGDRPLSRLRTLQMIGRTLQPEGHKRFDSGPQPVHWGTSFGNTPSFRPVETA